MYDILFDWALYNNVASDRLKLIWNKRKTFFCKFYSDKNYKFLFLINTLKKMARNMNLSRHEFVYADFLKVKNYLLK